VSVRVPNRFRLLPAVLVAHLAVLCAGSAQVQAARPRIEDVEDSLAHDRSFKVRVDAALILGRLRQSRSVPALIGALRDSNPTVRASAAEALGMIGSPIARDAVLRASQDPSPLVRHVAKRALKQLADDGENGQQPGDGSGQPEPLGPAIRPRGGRRVSFEVKQMGDRSHHASPGLRSHMRDFLVDQLRPAGDVARPNEGNFAVDGVIRDLSTATTRDGDVEVTCSVQLMVSRQPGGGVFMLTSGEATVQKPKRQWRPQQTPAMELEALENAVRAASEDLVRNLSQQ
jgi:hypothetical protein